MLDSRLAEDIACWPVLHEAPCQTLKRTRRLAGAVWLGSLFVWGVLLYGCGQRALGAERTPGSARSGKAAARIGTHIPSRTGQESLSYRIELDAQLTQLDVQVCPRGFRIERLNAPSPGVQALLEGGHVNTPEGDYACPEEGLDLPQLKADECLRYSLHLREKSFDLSAFRRAGGDLLASPDVWLWVPTPRPVGLHIHAHFVLPDGVRAAMPWARGGRGSAGTRADTGTGTEFEIPETAFAWKSGGGFTHSAPVPLAAPGAELELAVLGAGFSDGDSVSAWLEQGARTSSLLFGHFPVPRALVLAVPSERAGPAFGMALRGGGPAVVIFLDRRANAASLADDWTSTHEFLHLGVPRLPPEDAWLFEGLATYYTEVTRARAGIISPAQAYQHLLDGFGRGRTAAGQHTLREDSAEMRARHAFYRVYWSGAALALLTDVAARRAGGPTLDSALRGFAQCCASAEDDWTAERVLARLDAALGAPRFTDQARTWLDRTAFPDLDATLHALGVASGAHGEAAFTPAADSAIRTAIMARELQSVANGEPHQAR